MSFILESKATQGVASAQRRCGEGRDEGQEEGQEEERGSGGSSKEFALVVKLAGDELPPLLF